jgi:hypothetical protein
MDTGTTGTVGQSTNGDSNVAPGVREFEAAARAYGNGNSERARDRARAERNSSSRDTAAEQTQNQEQQSTPPSDILTGAPQIGLEDFLFDGLASMAQKGYEDSTDEPDAPPETKQQKRQAAREMADTLILMLGMGAASVLQQAGYTDKEAARAFPTNNEEKLIKPGLMQVMEMSGGLSKLSKWASPFLLAGGLGFWSFRIYNLYRVKQPAANTSGIMQNFRARVIGDRRDQAAAVVVEQTPTDSIYAQFANTPIG